MKILLGIDSWYPNVDGVVVTVENYCRYLHTGQDSCEVVVPAHGEGVDEAQPNRYNLPLYYTKSLRLPFLPEYICPAPNSDAKLRKKLKEGAYDVLHAHSPFYIGEYLAKAGKKYGIPTVYTFHTKFRDEFLAKTRSEALSDLLVKRILRTINLFDYVFAVSEGAAETLRAYGYKKEIRVLRNGTDLPLPEERTEEALISRVNAEYGLENAENVFLYVGRVVEVKNLPFTLKTLKILKDEGVDFTFIVIGEGAKEEECQQLAADLGIADNVKFLGSIGDRSLLQAFYLRADLFLFPSVFDNASLTILEAASGRLPILVPTGSSSAELVKADENGFVVDLDERQWANKIKSLVADREKLAEVSRNSRETIYRSWKTAVDEARTIYEEMSTAFESEGTPWKKQSRG